jgi:hypothetical protein
MKYYSALFILFFAFTTQHSLEAKLFDAMLVTQEGDTIHCEINVRVNLFRPDLVDPLSCKKKLKTVSKSGKKVKYSPDEIKSFIIYSTSKGDMLFESQVVENERCFVHFIYDGQNKVYHYVVPHGYDGAPIYFFVVKSEQGDFLRLLPIKWRKQLAEYFPETDFFKVEKEAKKFKYEDLIDLIKAYERQIS